jgi:hypothetical protein
LATTAKEEYWVSVTLLYLPNISFQKFFLLKPWTTTYYPYHNFVTWATIVFKGVLKGKLYVVDFTKDKAQLDTCLITKSNMGWLWHRRLAHVGMKNLHKLLKCDHVIGLTNVVFEKDGPCGACQAGKKVGSSHPTKNIMATSRPLELLHMDLFGPIACISMGGNKYGLVIVDDYTRFT